MLDFDTAGFGDFLFEGNFLADNPNSKIQLDVPAGVEITQMRGNFIFAIPEPFTWILAVIMLGTSFSFARRRFR